MGKRKQDLRTEPCMNTGCPRTGYLVSFAWNEHGGDLAGNIVRLFLCERCETILHGACLPMCSRCDYETEAGSVVCKECAAACCAHCGKVVTEDAIECASCNKALNEEQKGATT